MKYCKNSHNCPWGSAVDPGTCAYAADIDKDDDCPMIYKEAEILMDKIICGSQSSDT